MPAVDRRLTPRRAPGVDAHHRRTRRADAVLGTRHRPRVPRRLSYGYLVGEVVRRITGRSLGTFFADEVARPLGLEFFIGLPEELRGPRLPDRRGQLRWAPAPARTATTTAPARRSARRLRVHARRPLAQPRRRHPGPRLDEPARPGTPPRCPAATASPTPPPCRACTPRLIGPVDDGPDEPLLTPAQVERARTPLHVGSRPGLRLGRLHARAEDRARVLAVEPGHPLRRRGLVRPRRAPVAPTASPIPRTPWPSATS